MSFVSAFEKLNPIVISLLAVAVLICPRPSLSASFLFFQSISVTAFLLLSGQEAKSGFLATSVLLCLFAVIAIGTNLYLEIAHKIHTKTSKFHLFLKALLLLIFFINIEQFSLKDLIKNVAQKESGAFDGLATLIAGFALFAILLSALSIMAHKNSHIGNKQ